MTNESHDNKELALRENEAIAEQAAKPAPTGIAYAPDVDIYETPEAVFLKADLPGVKRDNLDVDIRDGVLTITATVDAIDARNQPVFSEYGLGGYRRSFSLGRSIDQTKIGAVIKDGVLTLELPKADSLRPRKVEIQA